MKKFILIPLLLISFCFQAQIKPFKISQPLQLESVEASVSASDSVLVWTSGKLVKFVPRSAIGGGSIPNINQVLGSGYEAFNKYIWMKSATGETGDPYAILHNQGVSANSVVGGNTYASSLSSQKLLFADTSEESKQFIIDNNSGIDYFETSSYPNKRMFIGINDMIIANYVSEDTISEKTSYGINELRFSKDLDGASLLYEQVEGTGDVEYIFGDPDLGSSRSVVTKGDLTLDLVLNNDNESSHPILLIEEDGDRADLRPGGLTLSQSEGTKSLTLYHGYFISQDAVLSGGVYINSTPQHSGDVIFNYPTEKENLQTLATLEDLVMPQDNETTTALSLSDLNSNYSSAKIGFKVYCVHIITGAMIYEKTENTWVQYLVTEVTD